jgi:hypothetical protein
MQIWLSAREKAAIRSAAKRAGMDMSAYVLRRVLSASAAEFRELIEACRSPVASALALAELNSLLSRLTAMELTDAIAAPPMVILTPFLANYIAAMIESVCEKTWHTSARSDAHHRAALRARLRIRFAEPAPAPAAALARVLQASQHFH